MLDRESTFADPTVVDLLKSEFVPVAIDQAYQRRQKDTEGDFYRKIARDSPRGDGSNGGTTQGLYIAAPDGTYLGFSNHRSPERILLFINNALGKYEPKPTASIQPSRVDKRYNPQPPAGGLVIRVQAKVLGGYASADSNSLTNNKSFKRIFQTAISRDNLWVTKDEHRSLVEGKFPSSLLHRIARFHLVDNTRGEPPMWRPQEIQNIEMSVDNGIVTGSAKLQTGDGERGYDCEFYGKLEVQDGQISRFDVVALGNFWGEGRYTGGAPEGKFPLGISFTLADGSDLADPIPPQGSRGWVQGYLKK